MAGVVSRLARGLGLAARPVALFAACTIAQAWAVGPADPFSPPAAIAAPSAAAASAPARGLESTAAQPRANGLSGVRIGRQSAALIDGQWVLVGQPVGKAVLWRVAPDSATLRHADGRLERLLMNAGVELQRLATLSRHAAEAQR